MNDTSTRARLALAGAVAVAQFARQEWIDDSEAIAVGYHVTNFDDSAVGDSPGNPPYMAGPGTWEPSFEPGDAWRALGATTPMTVDYRPEGPGKDAVTVLIDTEDERGKPLTVAIGINEDLGLFADGATIGALGGTPPPARDGYNLETMLPRDAGNLREHGVGSDERDRVWDALNGVARTHPAAASWHEWNDGGRDLPGHEDVDRARSRERAACIEHIEHHLDGSNQREYGMDSMYSEVPVPASREAVRLIHEWGTTLETDREGPGREAARKWEDAMTAAEAVVEQPRGGKASFDGLDERSPKAASTTGDHDRLRNLTAAAAEVHRARTTELDPMGAERDLTAALELGAARLRIANIVRGEREDRYGLGLRQEPVGAATPAAAPPRAAGAANEAENRPAHEPNR